MGSGNPRRRRALEHADPHSPGLPGDGGDLLLNRLARPSIGQPPFLQDPRMERSAEAGPAEVGAVQLWRPTFRYDRPQLGWCPGRRPDRPAAGERDGAGRTCVEPGPVARGYDARLTLETIQRRLHVRRDVPPLGPAAAR